MPCNVAILQTDLAWENPRKNLKSFTKLLNNLPGEVNLVLLPETFSTGFTMNVRDFADQDEYALKWMIEAATRHDLSIAGSLIVKDNSCYYNRLYWVRPDGTYDFYDKRHLFRMGREQENFCAGNSRVIIEMSGIRFLLQICYDIRFPVFTRNRNDYDAIIYVANFPTARKHVWKTLLQARAIENQSYVLAANRTGIDGEGVDNCGLSCVIDMKGKYKTRLDHKPCILLSSIDAQEIRQFRDKFPAYLDADEFKLL